MISFSFSIPFFLAQTGRGKRGKGIKEGRALKEQCAVGMSAMGGGREDAWGSGKGKSGGLLCNGGLELRCRACIRMKDPEVCVGIPDGWSGPRIPPRGWSRDMPGI